ncbi:SDR family oxidoreductase [Brucella sp. H1_1004]|uniref:SDR family oxidoreductase n=1 Tax=Brucella sp. H1_1004 TaxID=3110109 RepID=UPI0039B46836
MAAGGVIFNTTSILAERAQKSAAADAMSKARVSKMTRELVLKFASCGLRVNTIAPGGSRHESTCNILVDRWRFT